MWYIAATLGLVYGIYHGFMSFNPIFKTSPYYLYICTVVAAIVGLLWGLIARSSTVAEEVYKYGSAHDGAIVLAWYIGSIFIYKMSFSITEYIALALIITGTILLKIAG